MPYTDDMIANATADAYGQAAPDTSYAEGVTKRYGEATNVRAFDGKPGNLTELDALVAYLQGMGLALTNNLAGKTAAVTPAVAAPAAN